ncbi:MAG: hypothetical protein FWD61_11145 [Phycisphaerales bacterium]|nr:hypothetical protein [Phycisphaerales bacterium]
MAKALPYRRASGEPAWPSHGWLPRRRLLLALLPLLVIGIICAVAGSQAPAVFQACTYGLFALPMIAAAGMLGLAITAPFARRGVFEGEPNSGWPEAFRAIVSIALGLGAFSLGTLLLGALGLIEPHMKWAGGNDQSWVPGILLLLAIGIGVIPTRTFLQSSDHSRLLERTAREDWLLLLTALPIAMLLIAATFPPGTLWLSEGRGYDVLEYHLQLPREYAANNSTAPLPHNVYSYFPANVEMLYLLLMQLAKFVLDYGAPDTAGSAAYLWIIYPAQFLHAFMMLLAIGSLAVAPIRINILGRIIAMLVILGIPWTLITGSLAYNEAGMMLFGTLALLLAMANKNDSSPNSISSTGAPHGNAGLWRAAGNSWRWSLLGTLLGLAVGCKLTAGIFFAIPVALIVLVKSQHRARTLSTVAGFALLLYAPWALRAALYSRGNPIFPLAANILPSSDWTPDQVARFSRGHTAQNDGHPVPITDFKTRSSLLLHETILHEQWSPAWLSIHRWAGIRPPDETAWWTHIGILWTVVPIGLLLAFLAALRHPGSLSNTILLIAIILIQIAAWTFLTHTQSRFLLPMAIPLGLLMGLGVQGLGPGVGGLPIGLLRLLLAIIIIVHALCTVFLLLPEANLLGGIAQHENKPEKISLPIANIFEHAVNLAALAAKKDEPLPPPPNILLEGFPPYAPFYWLGNITYNTVFDKNQLADHLRLGIPHTFHWLQSQHIRYLIFAWPDITRLRDTYGFDELITPDLLPALESAGLQKLTPPEIDPTKLTILRVPPSEPRP